MKREYKIAIVGNGKAGKFLSNAFSDLGLSVKIFGRKPLVNIYDLKTLTAKMHFDLIFLCVSDKSIKEVSAALPISNAMVVHISGTTPLSHIHNKHIKRALFWPLMSLNSQTQANIISIPFCLEANDLKSVELLQSFIDQTNLIGHWTNEEQRQHLHLAAVVSQNFANHLFQLAYEITSEAKIDFKILKPLLQETVKNLSADAPKISQTGPAIRGDQFTIEKHLRMLEGTRKELYQLFTDSIEKTK